MSNQLGRLKQTLENLDQALEEFESTLLEFDESLEGEETLLRPLLGGAGPASDPASDVTPGEPRWTF